jgi:hypothetical protein
MLAPRREPSAEEIDQLEAEVAAFMARINAHKSQIADLWAQCAPDYWRLRECKRRKREQRLGPALIEKIRRVGETGMLPDEEPKAANEFRRI